MKTDLQYRKDEAIGRCKMVRKHFKELFCRRKEDDVLSFEQIRFEKTVAHPEMALEGQGWNTGQDCVHRYEIQSSRCTSSSS